MKASNNDKKKVIILSVLGILLLGVGAFQVVGTGAPAPAPKVEKAPAEEAVAASVEPDTESADPRFAGTPLPQRDPFLPQVGAKPAPEGSKPASVAAQTPKPTRGENIPVPPMPPMDGNIQGLPQPDGAIAQNSPAENTGNGAPSEPAGPSFRLSGVVIGDHPIALIQVNGGKQKAVSIGDNVSGHKVASITRNGVVLVGNGERVKLSWKGHAEIE